MRALFPLSPSPYLVTTTLLATLLVVAGCSDTATYRDYPSRSDGQTLSLGGTEISVEVASTTEARGQGLMYREVLPEDHGMLFIYQDPDILSFWMKNTLIPLSIAFFNEDGEIVNIEKMNPHQEKPSAVSERPVRFALEVNQTWFDKHGVKSGDKIELPAWALELIADKR